MALPQQTRQDFEAAICGGDEVLAFMRRLWALDHALQSYSRLMQRRLGITSTRRLVVRLVGLYPGIMAGCLADLLQIDPGTLTGLVRRLEEDGILRRGGLTEDGRKVVFHLTAKGRRINQSRAGTVEEALGRTLKGIPREEIQATERVLDRLVSGLAHSEA
jgi:MarR family transcriptional regulator, organic hydroperoxide resistance regulator